MAEEKLETILLEDDLVSREELQEALDVHAEEDDHIGQTLIDMGLIDQEELHYSLAEQKNLEYREPEPEDVDRRFQRELPEAYLEDNRVLPFESNQDTLNVLTTFPISYECLADLKNRYDLEPQPVVCSPEHLSTLLSSIRTNGTGTKNSHSSPRDEFELVEDDTDQYENAVEQAKQTRIIRLVNSIIREALEQRATDIHIEPQREELVLRFRIDGVLHEHRTLSKELLAPIVSRVKIMAQLDIAESRRPQDGRFTIRREGEPIDVRVATTPSSNGEGAVLRLLDHSETNLELNNLGFPERVEQEFRESILRTHGIILVSGPTGSGKTTTLYSGLRLLNQSDVKIITIEDPIEFELDGIHQIQVRPEIGLTFSDGLRSVLRQDPDIMMIGEIRDLETAKIAIQAALTGHLVLSTIHTNNASAAVNRLIDMGVPHYLIPSALETVLAQRLVRTLCPECKQPYTPSDDVLASFDMTREDLKDRTLYRAEGCDHCNQTGYYGRTGIFELLDVNENVESVIRNEGSKEEIEQVAREGSMVPLRKAGRSKVLNGETTFEEISRVIHRA